LYEVTDEVARIVGVSEIDTGLCTVFISHTSASLVIQENADPSARRDLERFFDRLVPDGDRAFSHVAEGPDDMPSHIRSAITATSLAIPIAAGRMVLGTWQGIYVWEHRLHGSRRRVVVHVVGTKHH